MKNTSICPKCNSKNILNEQPPKMAGSAEHVWWSYKIPGMFSSNAMAKRYICLDCGYAEVWFEKEELFKIRRSLETKK